MSEAPTEQVLDAPTEEVQSAWRAYRFPVLAFVAVAVWLVLVVWWSTSWLDRFPSYPVGPVSFPGSGVLEGWFRYDGGWYELIARDGYFSQGPDLQSPVAFFPGYPLAMRGVAFVVRNEILAGILVTFLCGLAASVLVYRWTADRLGEAAARTTVLLVLLFPYAWYLVGAVYADALFIVAVVGAFILVERDQPVLAGLLGAVATATRPVSVAVILGLVAVRVPRRGGLRNWRTLRPKDAGVLLSVGGLVAWSGYLWWRFADPLLWVEVQKSPGWDQGSEPRTWFKVAFFERLDNLPFWIRDSFTNSSASGLQPFTESAYTSGLILQGSLLLGMLALTVVVVRRLGWGYGIYCLALLAVPLVGTKDFQGVGRYLLAAFPCFAALALILADRPRWRIAVLGVGAGLLTLLTSAYARGYYVA